MEQRRWEPSDSWHALMNPWLFPSPPILSHAFKISSVKTKQWIEKPWRNVAKVEAGNFKPLTAARQVWGPGKMLGMLQPVKIANNYFFCSGMKMSSCFPRSLKAAEDCWAVFFLSLSFSLVPSLKLFELLGKEKEVAGVRVEEMHPSGRLEQ